MTMIDVNTDPMPDTPEQLFAKLLELAHKAPAGDQILATCMTVTQMIIEKNIAYGNSALEPAQIFSKATADAQIDVRIDDKLNRIMKGASYPGDNDILDLTGYFILKLVYRHHFAIDKP